ncbi:S41 family peptidase [uncultured Draconibacterium sp.]|uniref:S41 family peptidase n=1 Tax=uncultured Draconibacterium sp. TaxID=1573823 RepID=UPI0029C84618|nr:S41 family peptidase [uncultured Draconibacterium sp.]
MKNLARTTLLLFVAVAVFTACSKDDPTPDGPEASEYTKKVNRFIKAAMDDKYFWNEDMPNLNYNYETDSKEYFYKLLDEDDRFSWITDDVQELLASFEGNEKSFGWSLAFYNITDIGKIVAIVEFVYPETPASAAGFKRGDIILKVNGSSLSESNYKDLLNLDQVDATVGVPSENDIVADTTIRLISDQLSLNPVLTTNVVEHDGRKIGYLFYAQFITNYDNDLGAAFQSFISQNVTDLVVDLRYNPGGMTESVRYLASCIAPLDVVSSGEVLVKKMWNRYWQEYWTDRQIMSQLVLYFKSDVPSKMGLDRVYFLTGPYTASSSELTITGLKPYMDEVITVGDTTYGKFVGSQTLVPEMYLNDADAQEISNWALQPIVVRFANSAGVTDFENGFAPDILADDNLLNAFPLGDKNDPLFKAAIEDITGTPVVAMKSAPKVSFNYKMIDRGFSRFDENKRLAPIKLEEPEK